MDCLFCKIVNGEIPSKIVYEDDLVYSFYDIEPQAPFHILIIPKKHITSALEINDGNKDIVGHIFKVAADIACEHNIAQDGYRLVTNVGKNGGQTVGHMHFHMLGGRNLQWPPG
ncbi:MAG: histidine triad nucleotide-binding protein [Clostridia bacterium]|nr:histidine triad nucleotide-binding protein [Clostridia bacterium]